MTDRLLEAIEETFGPRCERFDPDCIGCQAWAQYDEVTAQDKVIESQTEEIAKLKRHINDLRELREFDKKVNDD